jgi:hypothetical protein
MNLTDHRVFHSVGLSPGELNTMASDLLKFVSDFKSGMQSAAESDGICEFSIAWLFLLWCRFLHEFGEWLALSSKEERR